MPPGPTAELYRALGNIPIDQHAIVLVGRRGTGFKIARPVGQAVVSGRKLP